MARLKNDGIVDEIAVEMAARGHKVDLTALEQLLAVRQLLRWGYGVDEIHNRLHVEYPWAQVLVQSAQEVNPKVFARTEDDDGLTTSYRVGKTHHCQPKPGKPHEILISHEQRTNGRVINVRCLCMAGRNFRGCKLGRVRTLAEATAMWNAHRDSMEVLWDCSPIRTKGNPIGGDGVSRGMVTESGSAPDVVGCNAEGFRNSGVTIHTRRG